MFIYLSKKIPIPNNTRINCVQWNSVTDWIAVGGEDGLLKIFKLESGNKEKSKAINGASNLSVNQTLEGHSGQVQIIAWNEQYQKLTSSDENGSIIVWTLHKGTWYEEMINNRNKSTVKGLAWNHDGQKICIVYEDGGVIVGSVDGNRIWGKELKKVGLSCVQWSPDSKYLLFGIRNGELHLYDDEGVFSMKVKIHCLPSVQVIVQIAGLHWYDGRNGLFAENCPVLAVVYQSGHVQLMRSQHDEHPIILDTAMHAANCCWNHDGSALAIVGSTVLIGEHRGTNVVQFFSAFGNHIRTLKLPGSVSDCSWQGKSLKIALTIDSYLLFADIRPNYKWCYFSQTLVYSSRSRNKIETVITFLDAKNNEIHQKTVKSLLSIAAHKDHCILATETDNTTAQYSLMVCNTLTMVIDCKYMDLKPMWVAINSTHVFAASQENFIMWHYMTPKSRSSMFKIGGNRHKKERLYHVDDTPSGVAEVIQDLDKNFEESIKSQATKDPICCMTCSDKTLLIGRRSGIIQRYTLPQVALVQRLVLSSKPECMAINCNSSKMSVIDCTGALSLITLQKDVKENYGIMKEESGQVERRDVWDMKWASDNPNYLAIMEKTRMYVLKDGVPEEPINSWAYIAEFENLEIKGVLLDELISSSNELKREFIINFEVKSLRDTRQLLQKVGVPEATAFIEKNPHPRLWRLLAEAAVQNLDLSTAEMAYVRRSDYAGVQLIKKLSTIQNNQLKKALVASYFNKFDEAENLYLKSDRRDMAIALREKLGDWFRVVELMKTGSVTSDSQLTKAWNNIGEYFMDRGKWETAKEYYQKANNYEKLITCYQYLEDYDALASCISLLPEKHPLLDKIAETFLNVGLCSLSVDAYLKLGAIESAVETCITLNHWDKALQLSDKHSLNLHVNQLFDKHVHQLLQRGRLLDTVQLYRKADRFLEAAELLFELANEQKGKKKSPLLLKKMYVLVGFLIEDHVSFTKTSRSKAAGSRNNPAVGLGVDSFRNMKLLDNPWHNAEAYHFLMLSQRQLMSGKPELALRTAIKLRAYDDVLNPQQTCSILAICAIASRAFEIASKAFTELEILETDCKKDYENIALHLFSKNEPKDPADKCYKCSNCSSTQSLWNLICDRCGAQGVSCMATGRLIENMTDAWQCNVCKHFTLYAEMMSRNTCPFCHFSTKL